MKKLTPMLISLCLLAGCKDHKPKWIEVKVLQRQDSVEGFSSRYSGYTHTYVNLRVQDNEGNIWRLKRSFNMYGFVNPGDTVMVEVEDE